MALTLRRQTIRQHTVDVLKAAGTDAADRIFPSPILPWRRDRTLPMVGVYTRDERGVAPDGKGNSGPFQLRQELELVVEALVEIPTEQNTPADALARIDSQAALDALCAQITVALFGNPDWYVPIGTFPPPLFDGLMSRSTHVELGPVAQTDRRTAAATITHVVTYGCVAQPLIHDDFVFAFFDVDVIDPAADPNLKYPGPDGRIELQFTAPGPIYVAPYPGNGGTPHAS